MGGKKWGRYAPLKVKCPGAPLNSDKMATSFFEDIHTLRADIQFCFREATLTWKDINHLFTMLVHTCDRRELINGYNRLMRKPGCAQSFRRILYFLQYFTCEFATSGGWRQVCIGQIPGSFPEYMAICFIDTMGINITVDLLISQPWMHLVKLSPGARHSRNLKITYVQLPHTIPYEELVPLIRRNGEVFTNNLLDWTELSQYIKEIQETRGTPWKVDGESEVALRSEPSKPPEASEAG